MLAARRRSGPVASLSAPAVSSVARRIAGPPGWCLLWRGEGRGSYSTGRVGGVGCFGARKAVEGSLSLAGRISCGEELSG